MIHDAKAGPARGARDPSRLATLTIGGGALAWCALALALTAVDRSLGENQSVSGAVLLG